MPQTRCRLTEEGAGGIKNTLLAASGEKILFVCDVRDDRAGGDQQHHAAGRLSRIIEAAILEHPAVADAAVIGIPHDDFGEQPMAFVILKSGLEVDDAELLTFLKDRLASFKLPRRIEFTDALPLSPMGKVLKQELRQPFWEGRERNV